MLAFLDLFGVLMIGAIGSLSITGLSTGQVGDRVGVALQFLQIDTLSLGAQITIVGILGALSLVVKSVISLFLVKKTMYFMARRAAVMSSELLRKFFTNSLSRINQNSVQSSIFALTNGVNLVMVGVFGTAMSLIADFSLMIIIALGLFLVDPVMAMGTAFTFGILAFVLYRNMHDKNKFFGEQQSRLLIESSQRIFEAISTYRELLVRNRRGYYAREIGKLRFQLADGEAHIGYLRNLSKYLFEITIVLGALILAVYQFSVSTPSRALATIAIFMAASTRITPATLRIQQGLLNVKYSLAQSRPTLELIDSLRNVKAEESIDFPLNREHIDFIPRVEVKDLSYSYDGVKTVIDKVSFDVFPGEFVAIVGSSGAGKTTLVDIILGALEPKIGTVKIAGLNPLDSFVEWPGAVAYVPQDSIVINGTIRQNLALGFPLIQLTDDFCWESLRMAKLEDFVGSLPDRLDSHVGDRGTRLSGGQKQRLGIARALVTKPKLLILDEATSSLDGLTEVAISESLRTLKGEVTTIVIAHRLSTIVNADRIYLLDQGQVAAVGSFSQLKESHPDFLVQAKLLGL
jgi:ABC-type multidrug transport system fused ATPase/permease subunit